MLIIALLRKRSDIVLFPTGLSDYLSYDNRTFVTCVCLDCAINHVVYDCD